MKIPRLLILASIIAAVHLIVIAVVMRSGCSSRSSSPVAGLGKREAMPPPVIPEKGGVEKKSATVPRTNFSGAGAGVRAVVPGDRKKNTSPEDRRGYVSRSLPPLPAELDIMGGKTSTSRIGVNASSRDPRFLPPPFAPRRFPRSAYRTTYAVKGNISRIPLTKKASSGILLDVSSRNILWMKDPDKVVPIASLTKIMTLLLACEDVASGRVSLDDRVKATPGAWRIREGVVWMAPNEIFTLRELMQATSVKSANDAAYLIGEYLGNGNIRNFIRRMNQRAAALGMTKTKFYNPHGLPGRKKTPDNSSTVRDLLLLSEYVSRIPLFMQLSSIRLIGFRKEGVKGHLKLLNHNRLLPKSRYGTAGVDGIKTGYTNNAGFCLALSCVRNGRRILAVGTGFKVSAERDRCMKSLVEWGFLRAADPAAPPENIQLPGQKKKVYRRKKR